MVELESTESIHLVEVKLVVSNITELSFPNSKKVGGLANPSLFSHAGHFGKTGQRHFHLKRNQFHCPTVNLDILWTLISEQARHNAEKSKDKAAVIDVTKAVRTLNIYYISFPIGLFQGSWQGNSPQDSSDREGKVVLFFG